MAHFDDANDIEKQSKSEAQEQVAEGRESKDLNRIKSGVSHTGIDNNQEAKLANPLSGLTKDDLIKEADELVEKGGLEDLREEIRKGALVAADPGNFENIEGLNDEERSFLKSQFTNPWKQPKQLYLVIICCSMAAVVQGQDQSLINGANIFFADQFGIGGTSQRETWLLGLVNAAPYFGCAVFACWLTDPLNRLFGRKGCILISLVFATFPCFWAAFTNSWQHLLAARFVLSIGIGPKSSTVPVFAAESAPPAIRGALVMMWQMWTAFGIMIGYVCSLMFYNVSSSSIEGLNWRLMLGSGFVPPLIVIAQVIFCPESPRWLLEKKRYRDAHTSLLRLRNSRIEAAKDLFYINKLLEIEATMQVGNRYLEMFTIPRNRRATLASFCVMFMQQFCINAVAYYSSRIFVDAGFTQLDALLGSWGFGMLNWLFAIPGIFTIDRFGRRTLLLVTFPIMSVFLLVAGFSFWAPPGPGQQAGILLGIYLFCMAYSPGEGPVPFTYSAECFPLYIRPIGMSWATSICWLFNGVLAITVPSLLANLTNQGTFAFFAAWNIVGFFLALCVIPETKSLSLEELDQVFAVPTKKHAAWGLRQIPYFIRRYILRDKSVKPEQLYQFDESMARTYAPKSGGH